MFEIKKCPFCGGEGVLFVCQYDAGVRVVCRKCGAQSRVLVDSSEYSKPTHAVEDVIKAWNKRFNDDE